MINGRKLIKQGEKISLRFDFHERDLLQEHTYGYPKLTDRLKLSLLDHDRIIARYSLEELSILLEFITAEAIHTNDKTLHNDLIKLCDRLIEICKSYIEE
jgi:hypothetical protein